MTQTQIGMLIIGLLAIEVMLGVTMLQVFLQGGGRDESGHQRAGIG